MCSRETHPDGPGFQRRLDVVQVGPNLGDHLVHPLPACLEGLQSRFRAQQQPHRLEIGELGLEARAHPPSSADHLVQHAAGAGRRGVLLNCRFRDQPRPISAWSVQYRREGAARPMERFALVTKPATESAGSLFFLSQWS